MNSTCWADPLSSKERRELDWHLASAAEKFRRARKAIRPDRRRRNYIERYLLRSQLRSMAFECNELLLDVAVRAADPEG
jgi:hypothetical protein